MLFIAFKRGNQQTNPINEGYIVSLCPMRVTNNPNRILSEFMLVLGHPHGHYY